MTRKNRKDKSKKGKKVPRKVPLLKDIGGFGNLKLMENQDPPDGFRAIPISQAMFKTSEIIAEYLELDTKNMNDLDFTSQIGMSVWNIIHSRIKESEKEKLKVEAINLLIEELDISNKIASHEFDEIKERVRYMFPEEIQPDNSVNIFIRKEISYLIVPFNLSDELKSTVVKPTKEDKDLFVKLQELDDCIILEKEYDEWEDLSLETEDKLRSCFQKWLKKSGAKKNLNDIAHFAGFFMSFIYRYGRDEKTVFKNVDIDILEEFFFGFVLRKIMLEPNEYPIFIPLVKLLYKYFEENNYCDAEEIEIMVDDMEPDFMAMLRVEFG